MKLIQRIGYYLGGLSMGLIILAFFLNGKKVSCDYGPEARVLKSINSKTITFKNNLKSDSTAIFHILKKGNVNFSKSSTRQKPCGVYIIEGEYQNQEITLTVENCDSITKITNFKTK